MSPCSYINDETTNDISSLLSIKRKTNRKSSSPSISDNQEKKRPNDISQDLAPPKKRCREDVNEEVTSPLSPSLEASPVKVIYDDGKPFVKSMPKEAAPILVTSGGFGPPGSVPLLSLGFSTKSPTETPSTPYFAGTVSQSCYKDSNYETLLLPGDNTPLSSPPALPNPLAESASCPTSPSRFGVPNPLVQPLLKKIPDFSTSQCSASSRIEVFTHRPMQPPRAATDAVAASKIEVGETDSYLLDLPPGFHSRSIPQPTPVTSMSMEEEPLLGKACTEDATLLRLIPISSLADLALFFDL